jgi:hypothetical protein
MGFYRASRPGDSHEVGPVSGSVVVDRVDDTSSRQYIDDTGLEQMYVPVDNHAFDLVRKH